MRFRDYWDMQRVRLTGGLLAWTFIPYCVAHYFTGHNDFSMLVSIFCACSYVIDLFYKAEQGT